MEKDKEKLRLGFAMCGSYCTYAQVFSQLPELAREYELIPILSDNAAKTDSRFGTAEVHKKQLEEICGRPAICTIQQAEPIGPKKLLDALLIAPCTGNTLAKLAHGVADSSVTMAAKSQLRNHRPVILAVSTNDGLATAAPNIGLLLGRKQVYFVPFCQDDWVKKPCSLVADFRRMGAAVRAALNGRQIQPLLLRDAAFPGEQTGENKI